jgi:hypothetical protein
MQKIKVVKASERVVVERSKPVRAVERAVSWVEETRREIQLKREMQSKAFFA